MIYNCKKCNCEFEVDILSAKQEVAYAVCAKCGYNSLSITQSAGEEAAVEATRNMEHGSMRTF